MRGFDQEVDKQHKTVTQKKMPWAGMTVHPNKVFILQRSETKTHMHKKCTWHTAGLNTGQCTNELKPVSFFLPFVLGGAKQNRFRRKRRWEEERMTMRRRDRVNTFADKCQKAFQCNFHWMESHWAHKTHWHGLQLKNSDSLKRAELYGQKDRSRGINTQVLYPPLWENTSISLYVLGQR